MMLRLSDLSESLDVVYELSALTVGKQKHESFLKTLYALGFEHGIRICEEETFLLPERVAEEIALYVRKRSMQDVIVMGIQSSDEGNSKVPYLVAEKLQWPCIPMVESDDVAPGNVLGIMQKGYTLNGRTIRAAMVTVAKAKA